jgi:phage tail sheath protein FI/predicted component of type VI protein secretion system
MIYKTPGVYVQEINTFPPSVVPVATAIPAFVGYTEKAVDAEGEILHLEPTRIESLLDFETYFGGDYDQTSYKVKLNTTNLTVQSVTPTKRFYLYQCLRHFYANGGGPCYIVSVGTYTSAPSDSDFSNGLNELEKFDEPTLLLFPDAVLLSVDAISGEPLGSLHEAALAQCAKLQDRFVIMDLHQDLTNNSDPITTFRTGVGTSNLKYGAAYYPWLQTTYRPEVHFRDFSFVDAEDDSIELDPATLYGTEVDQLVTDVTDAEAVRTEVIDAVDISQMADSDPANPPDKLTLNSNNFANMMDHFDQLLDWLNQIDDTLSVNELESLVQEHFGNLLLLPRAIAKALPTLENNLRPELAQIMTDLKADTNLREAIVDLIALEKNTEVLNLNNNDVNSINTTYTVFDNTDWIIPDPDDLNSSTPNFQSVGDITASSDSFSDTNNKLIALNVAEVLQASFNTLSVAIISLFKAAEEVSEFLVAEAEAQLFANHPVFMAAKEQAQKTMSLLPPSSAIAGIYATVDRTRGVWKAPANISVNDVVGPTVKINDAVQSDLNVHFTGKSINAIRAFTGKGTLVWGARTLAGNDNEWRYVPVRRFFNMAEESIKKATEPFVFEPNDANTWVRMRAMIENFLTLQWRAGALAGAKPEQAFYVKVGLGETMSALDILKGCMIVEIGMAVVRPAEFIILKFAHKMQVS